MPHDDLLQKIADAQFALTDIHTEWIQNSSTGEDYDDGFDAGLETAKDIARRADPLTDTDFDELRALIRDAERYRAFMSSERFYVMGWAGFTNDPERPTVKPDHNPADWLHFTLNVWDKHPAGDDRQGRHGRALLTAYIDHLVEQRAIARWQELNGLSPDERPEGPADAA